MKFIRDIIAEKTNMSGSGSGSDVGAEGETDNPGIPGAEIMMSNNTARVWGESPDSEPQNQDTLGAFGIVDRRSGFDFPDAQDDNLQDQTDWETTAEPSELFADIWEPDKATDTETDTVQDAFPDEFTARNTAAQDDDDPFFADPEPDQMPPVQDIVATEPDPVPEMDPDDASPFDRIEQPSAPTSSPFQRFRRKQTASATGPENATLDVAPVLAPAQDPVTPVKVPTPAAGRSRRQAGRVKTRLLGFGNDHQQDGDLFANGSNTGPAAQAMFPVGWMVVVDGPGCGTAFALQNGVSQIGRGEGQAVRLDYGDTSISRENHAAVAYDSEQREFFLGHGGKANLVRLNGKPVLSTEPLSNGALIRIGETTLRFVGFCGSEFDWSNSQAGGDENARLD